MVFGITVNPLDSLVSSFDSDEYGGSGGEAAGDRSAEFASEVHDLNKIDYNQFTSGYNKYAGSSEIVSNEYHKHKTEEKKINNFEYWNERCFERLFGWGTRYKIDVIALITLWSWYTQ